MNINLIFFKILYTLTWYTNIVYHDNHGLLAWKLIIMVNTQHYHVTWWFFTKSIIVRIPIFPNACILIISISECCPKTVMSESPGWSVRSMSEYIGLPGMYIPLPLWNPHWLVILWKGRGVCMYICPPYTLNE